MKKSIGGDMGLAAVSILHDMIHDAVIKKNTLHAALMIANTQSRHHGQDLILRNSN